MTVALTHCIWVDRGIALTVRCLVRQGLVAQKKDGMYAELVLRNCPFLFHLPLL